MFGFGCVAQGFYHALQHSSLEAEIKKIVIKNPSKDRGLSKSLFSTTPHDIFDDPEIDVIVELIDDSKVALQIAKTAFSKRIPLISANKKMIAENLELLQQLQVESNTPILYEGAVAGSIPILQNLEKYFATQEIESIRGILNGSTNYILSRMKREAIPFDVALKAAQDLGFAESDPTLDVGGWDAAYKTIILVYHAFGKVLTIDDLKIRGIDKLSAYELQQSRKENQKVKLISSISYKQGTLDAKVTPEILDGEDGLYAIDNELNAVQISGSLCDEQVYIGKGAGSYPTGSAVISDLNLLLQGFSYQVRKSKKKEAA